MSLAQSVARIGKLGGTYMLGGIVGQGIAMLLLPVFTRYLPPNQLGIVRLATQVMTPLSILVSLGMWASLKSHYFREDEANRPALVRTAMLGLMGQAGLICVLLSLLGPWLAEALFPNVPLSRDYVVLLWLMVVWGCFTGALIQMGQGVQQLRERAGLYVAISLFSLVFQVGVGVVAVVGLGWQGFGRQGTILIGAAVSAGLWMTALWRSGRGGFRLRPYGKLLKTGLTFVPHELSGTIALASNAWLLNRLTSTADLGIYGIAVSFAQMMDFPLFAINQAAYPTMARLMREGTDEARRQQSRLYTLMLSGMAFVAVGLVLFAPVATHILTAREYHPAKQIVPILVLAWMCHCFYIVIAQAVFYFGGGLWMALASVTSAIVGAGLTLLLVPWYGAFGAAWAMVGCFFTLALVIALVARKLYPLPWQYFTLGGVIGGAILLALADLLVSARLGMVGAVAVKGVLLAAMLPLMRVVGVFTGAELARGWRVVLDEVRSVTKRFSHGR